MMTLMEIQSQVDRLDGFYQALKSQEKSLNQEISDLKKKADILIKASLVIKHLLDIMVKDEINKMAGLVTYGLQTIFEDQNLSFKPVMSKKNERIYIELRTLNNGVECEYGTYGGSVAVIESFLLRIICMLKMKLARLLLLDETFGSISAEYIQNTSKFIGELSSKLGLDVLLVTHEPEFKNYANKVYRIKDAPTGIILEREK
jgi:DNA repair exonuclease SbcCD ATPase subunit